MWLEGIICRFGSITLPARLCFKNRAAVLCSKLLWISWRLCSSSRKISLHIWPLLCSLEEGYIEVGRTHILISYFMLCRENSLLNLSLSVMRRSACIKPNLAISAANGRI